jgi:serine/threonine protein kinase
MGGSQSDSAYKSQTALIQQEQHQKQQDLFWNDQTFQTELPGAYSVYESTLQQTLGETSTPGSSPNRDNATATVQPVTTGGKKRCTPTEDPELLGRDPRKIYQCTRKCGKRYGRKNDWKRNEEEGYPCKSWVCSLCTIEGADNVRPCFRKYHFVQHFRNIHPEMNAEDFDEASTVYSETEFPRKCGFCRHRFETRQERIDHIADHFKQGKCMLDWRDEEDNDSHNSADDDNDDGPGDDDFGGKPSPQPPFHPRGENDSKHTGSGGGSGGSASQSSNGGFFQFQLSQLGESQLYCADQPIKPTTLSPNISQPSTSPEADASASLGISTDQQSSQDSNIPAEGDHKNALAGDVLTESLKKEHCSSTLDMRTDSRLLEHPHWKHSRADVAVDTRVSSPAPPVSAEHLDISPLETSLDTIATTSTQHNTAKRLSRTSKRLSTTTHFLSVKLLGSGGFSTVDEVVHQQTGLHVGRKTLKNRDQTAIEELKKEVSVLQKLRHPHIIRFLGAYSRGDKMSILLSPVAETTLAVWLQRSASQKPANLSETIVKMFGCLASSVRYLHEQRPVVKHMDIKPQNILIVEGDQEFPHVVLSDFGVSSSEDVSDDQYKPLTRQYIAPEVFEGFNRKQASDIWSLGCVFAEMASVSFSQDNTGWLAFREAFSGRTGKHYWQDVSGIQDKLAAFLVEAKTTTEQTVVRALQTMLNAEPDERPDAGSLTMIFTPAPCCLNWPNDKATFPGPQEEFGGVETLAHQGDNETCNHNHAYRRNGTESEVSLSNAKTWLDDCTHTHEACHHTAKRDASTLPTRLIEILPGTPGDEIRARIIQTDGLEPTAEYVALSHVWGDEQPVLSSNTLLSMRSELPLGTLPVAVTNAIATAQRLGHRYCWLDSLCVLQDSEEEKERECTGMASIFRNAALTVVLDQLTRDNSEVVVSGTTDKKYLPSLLGSTSKSVTPGRLPASALLPTGILTTPNFGWDTRAWALQDRLLSRRFLHLGEQLYWECNTLKASETFPRGLSALVWEKVHTESGKGLQPVPTATPNCNSKSSNEIQLMLNSHPIDASVMETGKTCYDNDHLDTRQDCASNVNHARSLGSTEPQRTTASSSLQHHCQWSKNHGDDAVNGMHAEKIALEVNGAEWSPSTFNSVHGRSGSRRLNKACFQTKTLPGQNPGGGEDEGMSDGIANGNGIRDASENGKNGME